MAIARAGQGAEPAGLAGQGFPDSYADASTGKRRSIHAGRMRKRSKRSTSELDLGDGSFILPTVVGVPE